MLFARRREGICLQYREAGWVHQDVSTFCGWPPKILVTVDSYGYHVAFTSKQLPMVSISAIARDWRVSRPYVSRCVNHRGCPRTSLQEAREWRECYASKRPPVARQTDEQGEGNSPEDSTPIPLPTARDIAWRGYDAILDLVLELPQNVAAHCNPVDPQLALTVLESECTRIHCAAYEMYAVWSKVGPHISTATDAE